MIDISKELKQIAADLLFQVASLQAQVRILQEENNQFRSKLKSELDDKNT